MEAELNVNGILDEMAKVSDEIFFIYNPYTSRFTFVNEAFREITQLSTNDVYENPGSLLQIIHPEDVSYVKQTFGTLAGRTENSLMDFRIYRPDKAERWIRLKIYPIVEDNRVQYITGVTEDDSARKNSIFNMEKVNGWKNATLQIISHDLRGPIGIVKTLASAIAKHFPGEEHKQAREWLSMIEKISKRNLDLIKNVLSEESLSTAEVEISKERLDLVWEIKQSMDIFYDSQEDISKTIACTYSHEKVFGEIDSMKFQQIITNLVGNAIKFTKDGGKIKVHLEKLEKSAVVTVEDNGIGIPRKLQPLLFKKRTDAGRTGLKGEESVGLGLWIVKTLTEAHNGRVWFESEEHKGTKFYVELPLEN
jgi:two-component system sensor histidine kinase VicK